MNSKLVLKIVASLAVVAVIVLVAGKKAGWFGNKIAIKVAVEKAEKRDIIEVITSNGKVQPQIEVKLSPDVSGEIVELNVSEGDIVQKGDLLLKIKPDNYISARNRVEASLNNTRARLKQAEAQLGQSQLEYNRKNKLWEQKAISESEYEMALTNFQSAKAEKEAAVFSVQSAEASLREAEENLRKTTIYAPISGTISRLEVELGERVVGTELMTGTALLRIADMDKMEILVEVNENDIVRVHHADTAIIELDAYLGRKFTGLVTEIPVSADISGLSTDQVTNFSVKVQVLSNSYNELITDRNPYPFRPGMSATAYIQTSRKYGVISIPVQAITTRADTSQAAQLERDQKKEDTEEDENQTVSKRDQKLVVFMVADGKAVIREVEAGIQDDSFIEVLSGLEEGEEVITAPYSAVSKNLENNSPVEVVDVKELFKTDKKK